MFLLFRVLHLQTPLVFLSMSFSYFFLIFFIFLSILYFYLSVWSFYVNYLVFCYFFFFGAVIIYLLLVDISLDILKSLYETPAYIRISQYCFIWFILSEAALFSSFFYGLFSCSTFTTLEFNSFFLSLPINYINVVVDKGYTFYWLFLDLYNIVINTFYLFVSGLFANFFIFLVLFKNFFFSNVVLLSIILLAVLFTWNQLWEFSLLEICMSTNVFCSTLFVIDMLHFVHVNYGVLSFLLILYKLQNFLINDLKIILVSCFVLYWHFVDFVWFFLLRFIYFELLFIFVLF